MAEIKLEHITKRFGDVVAVDDVNLEIHDQEFVVFVGPSGCGKTTTLRAIAGLEHPDEGDIFIDGNQVNTLSPADRDIAFVFQFYALYPHLTVYDNIAFPLKAVKAPKSEIRERVKEVAAILQIQAMLDRKPSHLSGGEMQRVALGRAMVRRPKAFLMDEPMSNLDAKLRVDMRTELKRLQHRLGATTIFVTHDQVEAMSMADRIVIMHQGSLQQIGTPQEVYNQPHVVQTLRNAILRQQVAHAYLFSGMRGVGKTTAARILAKALNCEKGPTPEPCGQCESCLEITRGNSVDVIEIDGASNTGVDDVRELRENVKFSPFRGTYRISIIDEVHMLSNSAFNALLKTLEEPPQHAVFIFATTEVHKIPPTITSRCQHFNFRRIPRREIIARLQEVVKHIDVTIGERSLGAMARASEGSMRDALSLLDQAVAFGGKTITEHDVEDMLGAVPDELVGRVVDTVVAQDAAAAVALVGEVVTHGYDLRVYCGAVVERMRHLMIAAVVPGFEQAQGLMDLPDENVKQLLAEAKSFSVEQLQELFHLFAQAEDRLRSTAHPRFVFEVAAVRAARLLQHNVQVPQVAETPRDPRPHISRTPVEKNGPMSGASPLPLRSPDHRIRTSGPPSATVPSQGEGQSPPVQRETRPPKHVASAPPTAQPAVKTEQSPRIPAPQPKPPSPASSPAIRQEDWQRVVESVIRNSPNIGTFLEMGMLVKIEGNQVIVGFPKTASVACSRIQKEENRALIAKVCREVVGATIHLRVVELTEEPGDRLTSKQMRAKQQEQDGEALLEQARANPMVKHAMELFGGEVVKASRVTGKKEA